MKYNFAKSVIFVLIFDPDKQNEFTQINFQLRYRLRYTESKLTDKNVEK